MKREDIKSLRVKGGHLSVIRARTVTIFQKYDQGSYYGREQSRGGGGDDDF